MENRLVSFTKQWHGFCVLCMRARPNVQTLVSFLATRVKEPDKDDWGKLRHGLMYLKGTLCMKRYMGVESLCIIK